MHKILNFQDEKLLLRALTHRSYINENPGEDKTNERLEFLGDALLNFLCAEYLYDILPEMEEGEMTRRRAALVDEKQLAQFALEVGLAFKMRLSQGAIREGGYQNQNLLSSTFESVIAAYYLDNNRDLNKVRDCLISLFESVPKNRVEASSLLDAKNRLQEIAQAQKVATAPKYQTSRIGGTDHAPKYLSIVYVHEQEWGRGTGHSKKEAEKQAAGDALSNWENRKIVV
jgi:ribonuclease-3